MQWLPAVEVMRTPEDAFESQRLRAGILNHESEGREFKSRARLQQIFNVESPLNIALVLVFRVYLYRVCERYRFAVHVQMCNFLRTNLI